jgi:hypothetical protein
MVPLEAGRHLHRHLYGAPRGRAPSTSTPKRTPRRGRMAFTSSLLRHPHQHISDIVQAPTRRSRTPPTCPSPMKQSTICFADEAKASHPVRHRQGGHHQAWHRQGEARPHLHHRTSTSRRDTAKHRRSDGRTTQPFYITTTPSSPSWRRRDRRRRPLQQLNQR